MTHLFSGKRASTFFLEGFQMALGTHVYEATPYTGETGFHKRLIGST